MLLRYVRLVRNSTAKAATQALADQTAGLSNIKAVEESYRVAMGLQAPVEYWKSKAENHGISESKAHAFYGFSRFHWSCLSRHSLVPHRPTLLGKEHVPQAIYVLVAAALGSSATLIFLGGPAADAPLSKPAPSWS